MALHILSFISRQLGMRNEKKQFSGFGVIEGEKGIEILICSVDSVNVVDT